MVGFASWMKNWHCRAPKNASCVYGGHRYGQGLVRVYELMVLALKKVRDEHCMNLNERELAQVGQ
jgi:hypothetical protein